ncbi:hypothetical protein LTR84_000637 [Exophiala bonariae]|uniref:AB hydrolase-1 domain-containing protein n=1 Tax=Exophiala bonariae TaxID=1690606 RepID=A0AAV9NV50_9EURO|nr:hypothetical protein LTR84_000637 [Exophiala bonariae]
MRSTFCSMIVALASGVIAAPLDSTAASPASFVGSPAEYLKGFKNPTISSSEGGHAICLEGLVDITASAENVRLNLTEPANQMELTNFLVEGVATNSTIRKQIVAGKATVSGTWSIHSRLCFPSATSIINATTVQFLIHGLGADTRYWDNAPGYSFVDYAAQQGYTTFSYDRLGSGLSDHPDPINVVQQFLHIEIAHELIQLLRTGGFAGQSFKHVINVGHSAGSVLMNGLAIKYPKDMDAAVLTGYTANLNGQEAGFAGLDLTIANLATPTRFAGISNGYLTAPVIQGPQWAFFRSPGYDPALLNLLWETKGTITLGEYITSNSVIGVATNFTGPIDAVSGEYDLLNCAGNCYLPRNWVAGLKEDLFPNASNGSDWYVGPGSGHFLTYHYAAANATAHIQDFIRKNGF